MRHVFLLTGANEQAVAETARAVRESGTESSFLIFDFAGAEASELESIVQRAWDWKGKIDVWVNNAGADVLTGVAADWDFDAKLTRLWEVDVRATIHLSRAVGHRMKAAGGVILNMGWDQADSGMEGDSGQLFSTIKAANSAFSHSLAKSLAPRVRVNCLAPGWIRTAWADEASASWQARARGESLLGRWGTPEDVAQTAAFLASPAAEFINGQTIAINGGFRSYRPQAETNA